MSIGTIRTQLYSRKGLWSLFLICAFPLHFWTLLLSFRDVSWLIERSNLWDAIGVVSYAMVFAFVESLTLLLVVILLGLLISRKWDEARRISLIAVLVLITSFWAMYGQAYFIWSIYLPDQILRFIAQSGHPYRYLFGISLVEVVLTVAIPAFLVLQSDKFFRFVQEFIDRISLLAGFYLLFDLLGLIIIIIRNI